VTAEPHFAVDQPSDTVVLRARPDNKAARRTAWSEASCRLLPRHHYRLGRTDEEMMLSLTSAAKRPVAEILQATNALEIARLSGADLFASDRLADARRSLIEAQHVLKTDRDRKRAMELGRTSAELAASARRVALVRAADRQTMDSELTAVRDELRHKSERIAELESAIETERRIRSVTAPPAPQVAAPALPAAPVTVNLVPTTPVAVPPSAPPPSPADNERTRLEEQRAALAEQRAQLQLERQSFALQQETERLRQELKQQLEDSLAAERQKLEERHAALETDRVQLSTQLETMERQRLALENERVRLDEEAKALDEQRRLRIESQATPVQSAPSERSPSSLPAPAPAALDAQRRELDRLGQDLSSQRQQLEAERRRLDEERVRLAADEAALANEPIYVVLDPETGDTIEESVVAEEPRRKRRWWPFNRKRAATEETSSDEPDAVTEPASEREKRPRRRFWIFGERRPTAQADPEADTSALRDAEIERDRARVAAERDVLAEQRRRHDAELDAERARLDAERARLSAEAVLLPVATPVATPAPTPASAAAVSELQAEIEALAKTRADLEAETARLAAQRTMLETRPAPTPDAWRERVATQFPTSSSERGLVVRLADLSFAPGRYELDAKGRELLARLVGLLATAPEFEIEVEGHTDNTGPSAVNRSLSEKRAASVVNYLIGQGVPARRLVSRGVGDSQPIASNDTPDGRRLNRRVVLILREASNS
ncbi:MAG: OmpA family protein, partial [Acidobacteriota bacterium]|nr:OmpA family protein [Acidobacteriota bacterium]